MMKCVVVSKAFNKVVEEQTKFKQIKHQLKALGFNNEYAGQMADTLNNACWVFDHFEKIQGNLRACPGIDIRRLSLQQLYLAKNLSWCLMMEDNSKAKRKKPRRPLYDKEEFTELLEMVRGSRAYSKVRHDKHLTTGLMLRLQRALVKSLDLWVRLMCHFKNHSESALICGSGLKMAFLKAINHSNGCASIAFQTF